MTFWGMLLRGDGGSFSAEDRWRGPPVQVAFLAVPHEPYCSLRQRKTPILSVLNILVFCHGFLP